MSGHNPASAPTGALTPAYLDLRADTRRLPEGPKGGTQEGEDAEVEEMDFPKEQEQISDAQLCQEPSAPPRPSS